ncbi:MAG TPA: IS66 family insertion sequence element accessory protein TnpB [Verrucomicrobiae bacterium]|jgi:transposase|nr:IS66 family insertion sequence element accessory protein TnpB [Verrucomicrobiae bacterium]
MLSFHSQLKVFVATAPCDLRMNFNGLWAAASERLGEDPKSGALFVFGNRRRNRIKILYFDGTGVVILAKRLEEGTFHWPQSAGEPGAKLRLSPQALQLLLDGVELKAAGRRAWYEAA